ncbi:hypothetical protein, partial [Staphylococcus aureus]
MYSVRVTAVESYRYFIYNQTEQNESFNNEPNLIATIQGIERPNVKASFGSMGHLIIEKPKEN